MEDSYDPEDGRCDSHSNANGPASVRADRDLGWMRTNIAGLSRDWLTEPLACSPDEVDEAQVTE